MAPFPRWNSLRVSLAACGLAASVIAAPAQPAAAKTPGEQIEAAWSRYFQGQGLSARKDLARLLKDPKLTPGQRLAARQALLDICIHAGVDACVVEQVGPYLELAKAAPAANDLMAREQVRTSAYYLHAGQFAFGTTEVLGRILKDDIWKQENALNGALYLRRQVLAANVALATDDRPAATRSVDKVLSLVATLETPQDQPFLVAWALREAMSVLVELGESDRAYGVYRATGGFVVQALPPLSVDAALYRLTQAELLQERGDLAGAAGALDAAIAALAVIELDEGQGWMLANARTLQAAVCAGQGRLDCAQAALKAHPYARLYAKPGRTPATYEEVIYLAARGLVAALAQTPDPIVAAALGGPLDFTAEPATMARAQVYRAAGAALALPPGAQRQEGLAQAGRGIVDLAGFQGGGFGGWSRPGAIDRILIGFALTQADRLDSGETAFALMQLAARQGATTDADALTLLAQAGDVMQRREIHQALRLRARRDRFEREALQAAVQRAAAPASGKPILSHAVEPRGYFRDFADRLLAVDQRLAERGLAASGANLVSLTDLQQALGADEAALALAEVPGGLAYMCVRREGVMRKVAPAGASPAVDIRLLQAALTAGHVPSEALDAQYPVAAALRLYDRFIRPFEGCLKPGDDILWLPNASITPIPLAALLANPPPKLAGGGFDLAQADWLVRRHGLSYAGSPAAVVAARRAPAAPADLDFLGVGDPILSGATPGGEDRAKLLLRGVRGATGLAALAALPDTAEELRRSAGGFRNPRLLMQDAATEQGVRSQLLGAYRFMSFATHGLLRDDLQGLSEPALALTPVSAADPGDDGLLTATEIADLNLAARFVALSACNTANFDMTQMAGDLPALASAFAIAGTPAVLGTLWPVDSLTGKEVVARTFETLGAGRSNPARALAEAQRAFLAAPPGRAYLHPRFWAAMVVLGDGGAVSRQPSAPQATPSVRTLAPAGEVLSLDRKDAQVVARFGDGARRAAATVSLGPLAWRQEVPKAGAARLLVRQGEQLIVGAVEPGPEGRYVPALQALDARTGAVRAAWRGEAAPGRDAFPMDAARGEGGAAVLLVADRNLQDHEGGGDALRLLAFDSGLKPRLLAQIAPAADQPIDNATVTAWGETLLVTYSRNFAAPARRPFVEDDFEAPPCSGVHATVVELRDARTGALRASGRLEGWSVVETALSGDRVVLAGARKAACTDEERAGLVVLDAALNAKTLWQDGALGLSQARGVLAAPDGSLLVGANKQALVDVRPAGAQRSARALAGESRFSTVLVRIDATGKPGPPRVLDSGGDVLITALAPGASGGLLLGGSVAGAATVIDLAPSGEPTIAPAS